MVTCWAPPCPRRLRGGLCISFCGSCRQRCRGRHAAPPPQSPEATSTAQYTLIPQRGVWEAQGWVPPGCGPSPAGRDSGLGHRLGSPPTPPPTPHWPTKPAVPSHTPTIHPRLHAYMSSLWGWPDTWGGADRLTWSCVRAFPNLWKVCWEESATAGTTLSFGWAGGQVGPACPRSHPSCLSDHNMTFG